MCSHTSICTPHIQVHTESRNGYLITPFCCYFRQGLTLEPMIAWFFCLSLLGDEIPGVCYSAWLPFFIIWWFVLLKSFLYVYGYAYLYAMYFGVLEDQKEGRSLMWVLVVELESLGRAPRALNFCALEEFILIFLGDSNTGCLSP